MTDASGATFELLPAIDLIGGRVVRLEQGDFTRATAFSDDPAATAASFVDQGAPWLHVVDLDGARAGRPSQTDSIQAIVAVVAGRAQVEVAGGLRTERSVDEAFAAGADRVVLGTAAIREPALASAAIARHGPASVVVAVDVRDGSARSEGWQSGAGVAPDALIRRLSDEGVETFEVTAIDRDGLLGGPDLALIGRLVALDRGSIIASGGIRSASDLRAVEALGCSGAIVGRALYDGSLTVAEALAAIR